MWCFALVNNRLVEIYFETKSGKLSIFGHAYVEESEFKTRHEMRLIREDTKKYHLSYREKKYTDKLNPTRKIYVPKKNPFDIKGKTYPMKALEKLLQEK